jgi:hypothetical protein
VKASSPMKPQRSHLNIFAIFILVKVWVESVAIKIPVFTRHFVEQAKVLTLFLVYLFWMPELAEVDEVLLIGLLDQQILAVQAAPM